jgi:hypothetical protein
MLRTTHDGVVVGLHLCAQIRQRQTGGTTLTGTTTLHNDVAAKESRRWIAALGIPMITACAFTAASLAGLGAWLLAPAIIVGPGIGGIALVWLALSTDTNGVSAPAAGGELHASALVPAEPTA